MPCRAFAVQSAFTAFPLTGPILSSKQKRRDTAFPITFPRNSYLNQICYWNKTNACCIPHKKWIRQNKEVLSYECKKEEASVDASRNRIEKKPFPHLIQHYRVKAYCFFSRVSISDGYLFGWHFSQNYDSWFTIPLWMNSLQTNTVVTGETRSRLWNGISPDQRQWLILKCWNCIQTEACLFQKTLIDLDSFQLLITSLMHMDSHLNEDKPNDCLMLNLKEFIHLLSNDVIFNQSNQWVMHNILDYLFFELYTSNQFTKDVFDNLSVISMFVDSFNSVFQVNTGLSIVEAWFLNCLIDVTYQQFLLLSNRPVVSEIDYLSVYMYMEKMIQLIYRQLGSHCHHYGLDSFYHQLPNNVQDIIRFDIINQHPSGNLKHMLQILTTGLHVLSELFLKEKQTHYVSCHQFDSIILLFMDYFDLLVTINAITMNIRFDPSYNLLHSTQWNTPNTVTTQDSLRIDPIIKEVALHITEIASRTVQSTNSMNRLTTPVMDSITTAAHWIIFIALKYGYLIDFKDTSSTRTKTMEIQALFYLLTDNSEKKKLLKNGISGLSSQLRCDLLEWWLRQLNSTLCQQMGVKVMRHKESGEIGRRVFEFVPTAFQQPKQTLHKKISSLSTSPDTGIDVTFDNQLTLKKGTSLHLLTKPQNEHQSLFEELQVLAELSGLTELPFPSDIFNIESGGWLLLNILNEQMKQIRQLRQQPDNIIKESILTNWRQVDLICRILANIVASFPNNCQLNLKHDGVQWIICSWRQAVLLQHIIATDLINDSVVPYPSNSLSVKSIPSDTDKKIPYTTNIIPPASVYYNAKRLQQNIYHIFHSKTPVYTQGIFPLYLTTDKKDSIITLLNSSKNHSTPMDRVNCLKQNLSTLEPPWLTLSNKQKITNTNNKHINIILIHGMRGCGLKTWKWIDQEPWKYHLKSPFVSDEISLSTVDVLSQRFPSSIFSCEQSCSLDFNISKEESTLETSQFLKQKNVVSPWNNILPTNYQNDCLEPATDATWHFHWPQLFIAPYLPEGSRILSIDYDAPLFRKSPLIKHAKDLHQPISEFSQTKQYVSLSLTQGKDVFNQLSFLKYLSPDSHPPVFQFPLTTLDMTIQQLSTLLLRRIRAAGFQKPENYMDHNTLVIMPKTYKKKILPDIIWMVHSMGGLILKYILISNPDLALRTKGIIFFGVPHFGSPMASEFRFLERVVPPYCRELHPRRFQKQFQELNASFQNICRENNISILSISEALKTPIPYLSNIIPHYHRYVVPPKYANPLYGAFTVLPNTNHIRLCHLDRPDDDRLNMFLNFIFLSSDKPTL